MPETTTSETPFWARPNPLALHAGHGGQPKTVPATALFHSQPTLGFDDEIAALYLRVEPAIGYHSATGVTKATASPISFAKARPSVGSTIGEFVDVPPSRTPTTALRQRLLVEVLTRARTPISLPRLPEPMPEPLTERRALADLARWTDLSTEELGELLGVSRRSIYNWLRGRPVRRALRERILRSHAVVRPLAEAWDPSQVARWLRTGTPAPATLVSQRRWDEVLALVREQLRPLRRLEEPELQADEVLEAKPYDSEVHRAALQAFLTSPPTPMRRRPTWQPAEATGATPEELEHEA